MPSSNWVTKHFHSNTYKSKNFKFKICHIIYQDDSEFFMVAICSKKTHQVRFCKNYEKYYSYFEEKNINEFLDNYDYYADYWKPYEKFVKGNLCKEYIWAYGI